MSDSDKVAIVFGASRGLGRQICLSLSQAGYIVILSSKSTGTGSAPDPNSSSSTIDTVLAEIEAHGGKGLAIPCDVRHETQIENVISTVMKRYGKIDALIYNPGAIWWSAIATTPTKRYDLMHQINSRGLYIAIQSVLPIFHAQNHGRIVSVSPPIYSRFVRGKTAYAMTKVSASIMTLGLSMDLQRRPEYGFTADIAISSLWPATAIQSAATQRSDKAGLRRAEIWGDAVVELLKQKAETVNGKLLLDEDFLREQCGYTDDKIDAYALVPGTKPRRIMPAQLPNLRVAEHDDEGDRMDSTKLQSKSKL